jgi:HK97 gp10 family phage protein
MPFGRRVRIMMIEFKMSGFDQLEKSLSKLPKEFRDSVERTALRVAAKAIEKRAKAGAPVGSGLLKKSIGVTVKKNKSGKNSGSLSARVGARTGYAETQMVNGKSVKKDPVKYAGIVEYGTAKMPARPFIRNAVESSRSEVMELLSKGYNQGLARVAKKIKKL